MSRLLAFKTEISEFQSEDEARLSPGAALNEAPDDCACPQKCVCGFSSRAAPSN